MERWVSWVRRSAQASDPVQMRGCKRREGAGWLASGTLGRGLPFAAQRDLAFILHSFVLRNVPHCGDVVCDDAST